MRKEDFDVIEKDEVERYEFQSRRDDQISYIVSYAECAGYLDRAWDAVFKGAELARQRGCALG